MDARPRPTVFLTLIVSSKVINHPYAEAVKDRQIIGREVIQTVRPADLAQRVDFDYGLVTGLDSGVGVSVCCHTFRLTL